MARGRTRTKFALGALAAIGLGGALEGCNAIAGTGDLRIAACGAHCDGGTDAAYVLDRPVPVYAHGIDKVDLLFVVDNSSSMADKQLELAYGIPSLVRGLVDPRDDGGATPQPVLDLHVAVITSSLGSHGTSTCDPETSGPHADDHGHLLPRPGEAASGTGFHLEHGATAPSVGDCPTPVAASALRWVFDGARDPTTGFVGDGAAAALETASSCVILSAHEDGCGYEETWEALYHFLADPSPYAKAAATCTFGASGDDCTVGGKPSRIVTSGIDDELLKERVGFLRRDSLLAVVLLSDENDASLEPAGENWLPWAVGKGQMPRPWAGCANVPDDFEPDSASDYDDLFTRYACKSCVQDPAGPGCAIGWSDKAGEDGDDRNLRAFEMTRRFGYNFLWPRKRYVDAFQATTLPGVDAAGAPKTFINPIFEGAFRTSELILVAGIVGVPPRLVQDGKGAPKKLESADWDKLVSPDLTLRDPHMIESIAPRAGVPLFDGDRTRDSQNGGDRPPKSGDLQYACIAPRVAPTATSLCADAATSAESPLCTGAEQTHYGAYPGLRHLRILHDLGPMGIVSSICAPSFAPIVDAIGARIAETLQARCFHAPLAADASGNVEAVVYEVFADAVVDGESRCDFIANGYCTPGGEPCRRPSGPGAPPTTPEVAAATLEFDLSYVVDGRIGEASARASVEAGSVFVVDGSGKKRLVCEVKQLAGGRVPADQAKGCATSLDYAPSVIAGGGFCYTEVPALFPGGCTSATASLRFVGNAKTRPGSDVFISLKR